MEQISLDPCTSLESSFPGQSKDGRFQLPNDLIQASQNHAKLNVMSPESLLKLFP